MIANEYEALTPEAYEFQKKIEEAVRPILEAHRNKFAYREMAYLASEGITLTTAELIIRAAVKKGMRA